MDAKGSDAQAQIIFDAEHLLARNGVTPHAQCRSIIRKLVDALQQPAKPAGEQGHAALPDYNRALVPIERLREVEAERDELRRLLVLARLQAGARQLNSMGAADGR